LFTAKLAELNNLSRSTDIAGTQRTFSINLKKFLK